MIRIYIKFTINYYFILVNLCPLLINSSLSVFPDLHLTSFSLFPEGVVQRGPVKKATFFKISEIS